MKTIVCSIMKDEPNEFIQRWFNSSTEADHHVILDTGSTNGCDEYARTLGITVHTQTFVPWRFDHARNHLLSLLPAGDFYVINLDIDEVLTPGWKQALDGTPTLVNRPRYKYVWSWGDDGAEGLVYSGDKIHHRNGFHWKHPVHEVIKCESQEIQGFVEGLVIHHHPDPTKSRGQYLPLLLLSVEETPDDDRNVYYCARELYFAGMTDASVEMFRRYLLMPSATWVAERAWAMRYLAKMLHSERESWLLRAAGEYSCRETWFDLALLYYETSQWPLLYAAATKTVSFTDKQMIYLNEAYAWSEAPYDLAAIGAYHMGLNQKAVEYGTIASGLNPNDKRLSSNLYFYNKRIASF